MPFRKTAPSEKWKQSQPEGYGFFYLTPSSTIDTRRLELQQGIEKQQKYIAELEEYTLHAKEPIEQDIETHKNYKKEVKAALQKVKAEVVEAETKISYKLCPMTALRSETSELGKEKIYINSTTRECKIAQLNSKNTHSFYLSKNLDLSNLNAPGLKSAILSLMLQESIINTPTLLEKVSEIKKQCAKYKIYQNRLQQTEDRLIEFNQKLNNTCKKMDDYEKSLPQEKQLLKQLQVELVNTLTESVTQEIERRFAPLPPGA